MRYKIEINLLALKELNSKISLDEAVLLDYLYWLCSSPSEDVEKMRIKKDDKKYTWFDYGHYIEETPIIRGKTKASITPKIKNLEKEEFIETIQDEKTSRKYVRLLPKVDLLYRKPDTSVKKTKHPLNKLNDPVKKTKHPPFRKLNIDNNTNNDKYTNDNIIAKQSFAGKEINELIELFKEVNPSYKRLFGNTTQRGAIKRLLDQYGYEKLSKIIKFLPKIFGKEYVPVITTPYQLEAKMAQLIAYTQKEFRNKSNAVKIY